MADRLRRTYDKYRLNNLVWLEVTNLLLGYNRKISTKREGPFKITKINGPVNYTLALPKSWKVHNVFHAVFVTPYRETDIHGPNYPRPLPEQVIDHDEYEVERIMNHRKTRMDISTLFYGKAIQSK